MLKQALKLWWKTNSLFIQSLIDIDYLYIKIVKFVLPITLKWSDLLFGSENIGYALYGCSTKSNEFHSYTVRAILHTISTVMLFWYCDSGTI